MPNTNGQMRFGVLARKVFSWDAAIRGIALDAYGPHPIRLELGLPDCRIAPKILG